MKVPRFICSTYQQKSKLLLEDRIISEEPVEIPVLWELFKMFNNS